MMDKATFIAEYCRKLIDAMLVNSAKGPGELWSAVHALLSNLAHEVVSEPYFMLLWCPECGERHIDEGEFATKAHHTHACQHCGHVWRPALGPTVGVQFLPGFKDGESA